MSSSALEHLSTAHAAALKGGLNSGNLLNKLTYLDAFFKQCSIDSSAMLQASFNHPTSLTAHGRASAILLSAIHLCQSKGMTVSSS